MVAGRQGLDRLDGAAGRLELLDRIGSGRAASAATAERRVGEPRPRIATRITAPPIKQQLAAVAVVGAPPGTLTFGFFFGPWDRGCGGIRGIVA